MGYVKATIYSDIKISYVMFNLAESSVLLMFMYSFAINFSYRFHVNNKNFNLTASKLDRKIYKTNNIILAISLCLIIMAKYLK